MIAGIYKKELKLFRGQTWVSWCGFKLRHAVLSACLMTGAAFADTLPPLEAQERLALPAVGLVKAAGREGVVICSGTLVAQDLVVTSAHCTNRYTGLLNNVEFIAGLNDTRFVANSGAAEIVQHPVWLSGSGARKQRHDMAIVRLARPIPEERVEPIDVFPAEQSLPRLGALVGYKAERTKVLRGRFDCLLSPRSTRGFIASDCPSSRGNSGGAVLAQGSSGWQLAAVIVGSSRINSNAMAVTLDPWLRDHINEARKREIRRTAQID